ncbi:MULTISPECIES: VOC family protein [unclassified Mycobacterium]|uniref:VOC family protein n=1 Tax=unclassified Mycobacterium TaxID=2642494 RepID=UPI0029C68B0C|nr:MULTISPECIES: VOC family protein [unclassified Mycobacterium]
MVVSPVRLNHAVLVVADVDRSTRFYVEVLGMEPVTRDPRGRHAFLRLPRSGQHHDLGLFGLPRSALASRPSLGLLHLGWQLDTIDELVEFRQTMLDAGVLTGESSHGAVKSLYGRDPDDNEFEIMWLLPREHWGAYENAAVVESLDLSAELDRWSGVRTANQFIDGISPPLAESSDR